MAMDYAVQSGVSEEPKEDVYISTLDAATHSFIDFQNPVCVFRFIY